jgi:hypothetical protein
MDYGMKPKILLAEKFRADEIFQRERTRNALALF